MKSGKAAAAVFSVQQEPGDMTAVAQHFAWDHGSSGDELQWAANGRFGIHHFAIWPHWDVRRKLGPISAVTEFLTFVSLTDGHLAWDPAPKKLSVVSTTWKPPSETQQCGCVHVPGCQGGLVLAAGEGRACCHHWGCNSSVWVLLPSSNSRCWDRKLTGEDKGEKSGSDPFQGKMSFFH